MADPPEAKERELTPSESHDKEAGPGETRLDMDDGHDDNDDNDNNDNDNNDNDNNDNNNNDRHRPGVAKSVATDATHASAAPPPAKAKPWHTQTWMNPLRWTAPPPVPSQRRVSREYTAGFWSKLTFEWMTPLMTTGYKRQLQTQDIWQVNPDRAVEPLTQKVKASFRRRRQNGQKNPLLWALHETFKFEFWLGGVCALLSGVLRAMAPFVLRYLIQFAADAYVAKVEEGRPEPAMRNGIGLAVAITAMQVLQALGVSHFIYRGMMVGGQSRGVLIGLLYEKAMVISGRAKAGGVQANDGHEMSAGRNKTGKTSKTSKTTMPAGLGWANGRIVNLMSVDTYRIDQASALFHMIWVEPIVCLMTLVLLLVNLTYSALAGFSLLVVGVPALTKAIQALFRRRKAINIITDQRVSLTQEILQSVRFVKYFGWEKAFIARLEELRAKEIYSIQVLMAIRNAINAVSMSLPIFASMLSFIVYSLSNHRLAPANVFSSLALFNGLRMPLSLLPLVVGQVTDAWSSMQRLEEFLTQEEQQEDVVYRPGGSSAIEVVDAAFTWERTATQDPDKDKDKDRDKGTTRTPQPQAAKSPSSTAHATGDSASTLVDEREPFQLHGLNFRINRHELVAVIGAVGSGKSSLLAALAGDMRKTHGDVVYGASRAFCPQYAWIQNTTLQNNITFGKDLDRDWYRQVVRACALEADLDMLPNGDQTEIGERGITISGGQKQRLNVARAIYFDADIVLMDDPLSAVDAHVGRHIFDHAILGLLKDKCRVLATHQLWVLSRCDRIIWMDGGSIRAMDTFDNLMRDHGGFQALMETTAVEDKEQQQQQQQQQQPDEAAVAPVDVAAERSKRKQNKDAAALMQQEEKAQASVPWSVYAAYVRASGTMFNAPLAMAILVMSQSANLATGLWLSWWTSDQFGFSTGQYIGIYAALGMAQAACMFGFSLALSILGTRASKVMLRKAVQRVLGAPMSFFDTTPLGRITNRFSRDVDVMDNNLTDAMRMYLFTLAMVTAVLALIVAYFHWFAAALVPLYGLFILSASYYRASAREVKRFESVLRSAVFARFGEGLSGVASIRAYGLQARFARELRASIDDMNAAYYLTFSNQRWLSLRLDMVGNGLVLTVAMLVVTSRFSVSPSIGGLVLSYVLAIVQMLQFAIRQLAEVENGINAVERLRHYGTQLAQEEEAQAEAEDAPLRTVAVRDAWPDRGHIVFANVHMRYRPGLPLVLRGLSMHIRAGERVGIVGRTGAGKTSVVSTLFRLVELEAGSVTIDGVDIATLALHDLRSRLAIIPQDPTLFRGSVRSNLDPFHEHPDLALWSALRQAHLVPEPDASTLPTPDPSSRTQHAIHLDTLVEEDGLNFSLGQRQLMALARALVRASQIIVCDEATSSVDMETDHNIQRTMAVGFRGKTLLCIAHRLRTILAYDRICVLDAGHLAEMDTPLALWHHAGIFRAMCDRSGIRHDDILRARDALAALDAARPSI